MTVLAFDTTGERLSVGVMRGGRVTVRTAAAPLTRKLLSTIHRLLGGSRPEAIVVCVGPGSYTGTRVGVVVANTLGWSWTVPVYGLTKDEAPTVRELLRLAAGKYRANETSLPPRPLYRS
jgi:tRNA threonylcarbamoyl adenosine modification protein YeaZ